jgi:hypothetical protein
MLTLASRSGTTWVIIERVHDLLGRARSTTAASGWIRPGTPRPRKRAVDREHGDFDRAAVNCVTAGAGRGTGQRVDLAREGR